MKKRVNLFTSVALLSTILMSCGDSTTLVNPTSVVTPTTSASYEPIQSIVPVEDYDAFCDTWSQKDHLYIHYYREDAKTFGDYEKYGLWLWQPGKAGALFAGGTAPSNMKVSTNSWMEDIGGKGRVDQAGVCADIDLNATTYITGETGSPFSLKDIDKLGYLVVKLSSMAPGNVGWEKDGGDNYFEEMQINKRPNGSLHIFLVGKSTENYRYLYQEKIYENPINSDETGDYRSKADLNSSTAFTKKVKTSEEFYKNAGVGYEIFVPSFRDSNGDGYGDLRGIIDSLDYLDSLSVKVLWLSPFLECNSYHGYDTIDYFNVDPRFGTNDDLDELIYKAHQKGMYILMDLVVNHSSNQSVWFKKARRGEKGVDRNGNEINYRDLFHFKFKGDITENGKKVEEDSNWIRDGESNYYYYAKFADSMPEFNYDYSGTRNMITDLALYYLGKGIDGFRLDAIKHIYMADESKKASGDKILEDKGERQYYDEEQKKIITTTFDYSTNENKNLAFWSEFSYQLKSLYPNCYIVGENFDGWDQRIAPMYKAMDSQFDFCNYYNNLNCLYANIGMTATTLASKSTSKFSYYRQNRSDFINASFTSNHDVARAINHINAKKSSEAGVETDINITGTSTQINRAKVNAAITILQPGISFIYYGDELGMSSNTLENEFDHSNNLDRFYRQSFKWQNESLRPVLEFGSQYTNAYDSYNTNLPTMEEQDADANSMLSFYQDLCEVKQDAKFPINGNFTGYAYSDNQDVYHYIINANSNTTKDYKFYIHTGGNSSISSAVKCSVSSEDEIVYSYNYTNGTLNPYGVLVVRSK